MSKQILNLEQYIQKHRKNLEFVISDTLKILPEKGHTIGEYICKGKGLRPALLLLTANAFGYTGDKTYHLAAAIELIHCASLLHDDIEDNASLRRGKKSAHNIFGVKGTLITGDSLLALAIHLFLNHGDKNISSCLAEAMLQTVTGQIRDLTPTQTLADYLTTTSQKTGSLIAASCQIGAMLAKANMQATGKAKEFGINLGIVYQLIDDVMDFYPISKTGKTTGNDFKQGKFTLPLRIYANSLSKEKQEEFIQKLKSGNINRTARDEITQAILSSKTITSQIRDFILPYINKATAALDSFPDSEEKQILSQYTMGLPMKITTI